VQFARGAGIGAQDLFERALKLREARAASFELRDLVAQPLVQRRQRAGLDPVLAGGVVDGGKTLFQGLEARRIDVDAVLVAAQLRRAAG